MSSKVVKLACQEILKGSPGLMNIVDPSMWSLDGKNVEAALMLTDTLVWQLNPVWALACGNWVTFKKKAERIVMSAMDLKIFLIYFLY